MKKINRIVIMILTFVLIVSFGAINISAADTYVVVGVDSLCGSNWDANDTDNIMTYDSSLGYYKKDYFDVSAGSYELKVVANGSDWYGDSTGQSVKFKVLSPCTVTVLFNAETKEVKLLGLNVSLNIKFEYSTVSAVGGGVGPWLNGALWDPAAPSNVMTEIEKGLYEITYNDVPAGSYQVKFAFDGQWTHNFGVGDVFEAGSFCEAVYDGSNIFFTMTEDSDVKLTLDIRNFDYSTKIGALYKIEYTKGDAQPTVTPSTTPSTAPSATPSATPTQKPGDTTGDDTSAVPSAKPSVKPSQKPSQGTENPEDNVETGDSANIVVSTMVVVFVLSAVVFAITTLKRKLHQ